MEENIVNPLFSAEDADEVGELPLPDTAMLTIDDVIKSIKNLDDKQRQKFSSLLLQFKAVFSEIPGRTSVYEHEIYLSNYNSWVQKPYPIPLAYREPVAREIQRMLDWGVIERASGPYVNPLLPVTKKDGSVRLCLDARFLNSRIIPDRERPENPEEILQRFYGARWLSTLDLTASHWQILIKKEHGIYTAFYHNGHMYQFTVIPYGLSTSVASFTRCLDQVLGPEVMSYAANFVDDLLIDSPDFESHCQHLARFFLCSGLSDYLCYSSKKNLIV
jgi:hypothetical protein